MSIIIAYFTDVDNVLKCNDISLNNGELPEMSICNLIAAFPDISPHFIRTTIIITKS
jgi:hypothetical protein